MSTSKPREPVLFVRTSEGEKRKPTPDELRLFLSHNTPLPQGAVQQFGKAVERIPLITHDPELRELDVLGISREMSLKTFNDYLMFLPESKRIAGDLKEVADEMIEFAKPRLINVIQRAFDKKGRIVDVRPIVDLFNAVNAIIKSQQPPIPGVHTHRAAQLNKFYLDVLERLSWAIYREAKNLYSTMGAQNFVNFLSLLKFPSLGTNETTPAFSGYTFVQAQFHGFSMVKERSEAAKELFDDTAQEAVGFDDREKFAEIEDISHLKRIEEILVEGKRSLLTIYPPRFRVSNVADVNVCLDKLSIKTEDGKRKFPSNSTMKLVLSRSSGELVIDGTQQPAKGVLGEQRYSRLKALVYKKLLGHFKNVDFADEELDSNEPVENLNEEVRTSIGEQLPDEAKPGRRRRSKSEIRAENFTYSNLRGMKGSRILAILERLCKTEPGNGSSHRIFISKSGNRVPVPIHGDATVAIGTLISCLKALELEPSEIAGAL